VFDDFLLAAQDCRFSNCAHNREPGCAIRAAIADGTLTQKRFERWRQLADEERSNTARLTPRHR
jgi:ribosome biogenesis GTPase / thiamine phosphate phosphatase